MPAGTYPTFDELVRLARDATVVPLHREVVADALTPVLAHAAVAGGGASFLLESVVGGEKWARYSFVGFEPDLIVRGAGDRFERIDGATGETEVERGVDPWERLRALLAEHRPPPVPWLPRFWGGAVGYVGYDAVRRFEPTVGPPLPDGGGFEFELAVGGTLLVFDALRQTLRAVVPVRVDGDLRARHDRAVERIERAVARLAAAPRLRELPLPDASVREPLPPSSFDEARFCAAVEQAKEHIRAGDVFQVVLSQRFRVPAAGADLFDVYRAMRVVNPSPYMYFVRLPGVGIAGASPETLVRLEDGVAEVRPIAGTRPRGATDDEDAQNAEELLADPKEVAEHVMLVDLGRNDLGRISVPGSVRVTERMAIERYSHVMHIVSNVTGRLAPGRDALDVLRATFPAGTLTGAPKVRAMQIIDSLEPEPRGVYGGAVGYIGFGGNLDAAIAIRTVVERDGELFLQAGAGIVEASSPRAEYEETVHKARAALVAIGAARR
jgi:anthranilate synthase component 1